MLVKNLQFEAIHCVCVRIFIPCVSPKVWSSVLRRQYDDPVMESAPSHGLWKQSDIEASDQRSICQMSFRSNDNLETENLRSRSNADIFDVFFGTEIRFNCPSTIENTGRSNMLCEPSEELLLQDGVLSHTPNPCICPQNSSDYEHNQSNQNVPRFDELQELLELFSHTIPPTLATRSY